MARPARLSRGFDCQDVLGLTRDHGKGLDVLHRCDDDVSRNVKLGPRVRRDCEFPSIGNKAIFDHITVFGTRDIDFLVTDVDTPGPLHGLDLVRFVHDSRVVVSGGCVPGDEILLTGKTSARSPIGWRT